MLNFLGPFKSYLYAGAGIVLLSAVSAAYLFHRQAQQEHDSATKYQEQLSEQKANYDATVAAIDALNRQISQLEGEYDLARYEAQQAKDKLAKHHIKDDLINKPLLTLRAINAGTKRVLDEIRCASNPRCPLTTPKSTETRPHTN